MLSGGEELGLVGRGPDGTSVGMVVGLFVVDVELVALDCDVLVLVTSVCDVSVVKLLELLDCVLVLVSSVCDVSVVVELAQL